MIRSMTAFSRRSHFGEWGNLVWEIRTVNHRYLEIGLQYPELFRHQEMAVRELIKKFLVRGKVNAYLQFSPGPQFETTFRVNEPLLQKLAKVEECVRSYFTNTVVNSIDLLSWENLLQVVEPSSEVLDQQMLQLLIQTLESVVSVRSREGDSLSHFLKNHCRLLLLEIEKVEKLIPTLLQEERSRLNKHVEEVKSVLDPQRLEQEILIWARKSDVTEELQRLSGHVKEVLHILAEGGVVGRRLDFMMQELNREANTLASKSVSLSVTRFAVEMKVLIEQMREQVQNIE